MAVRKSILDALGGRQSRENKGDLRITAAR
jgi:hypothetical protein